MSELLFIFTVLLALLWVVTVISLNAIKIRHAYRMAEAELESKRMLDASLPEEEGERRDNGKG